MDLIVNESFINAYNYIVSEEDENREMMVCFFVHQCLTTTDLSMQGPTRFEQRLNWLKLVDEQYDRDIFFRHLRMSIESFNKLLGFIRDDLVVNEEMAMRRGGAIIPELCLYCTIRWLAGGSYSDIFLFCGISKTSFYRVIWKTINSICLNSEAYLKISFPKTVQECLAAASGFESISANGCIKNCVAAVDGYLLSIDVPSKKEAKNVRSFFSGHYQTHGVNIQAACDHHCRFTFIGVAGPGSMGDQEASRECGLYDLIENLSGTFTTIGDCAYEPTEHMAPIYGGNEGRREENDTFNFFASQLRIRIEMTFGLMVKKWCILQHPSHVPLKHIKYMMFAIAKLHNFCINERLSRGGIASPLQLFNDPQALQVNENERILRISASQFEYEENAEIWPGKSANREIMKREIIALKLRRPGGKI
jgi:hypothetical protein